MSSDDAPGDMFDKQALQLMHQRERDGGAAEIKYTQNTPYAPPGVSRYYYSRVSTCANNNNNKNNTVIVMIIMIAINARNACILTLGLSVDSSEWICAAVIMHVHTPHHMKKKKVSPRPLMHVYVAYHFGPPLYDLLYHTYDEATAG